jgi:hypothetical protein
VSAIATLTSEGQLIDVVDMPVLNDGPAGRRAVNAPLLAARAWFWASTSGSVASSKGARQLLLSV